MPRILIKLHYPHFLYFYLKLELFLQTRVGLYLLCLFYCFASSCSSRLRQHYQTGSGSRWLPVPHKPGVGMVRGRVTVLMWGRKVRLFIKYSADAAKSSQVHRINF